ncbi:MAG: NAD(P)-dependent alcohol dehydrogenase [Bacteroidota bacterium]
MKAVFYAQTGGPEVLQLGARPTPALSPDQVLIRVHATALNPIDCEIRQGKFGFLMKSKLPRIPGSDFAGMVVEVGANAQGVSVGEKVYGMSSTRIGGAAAEYIAIRPAEIGIMPPNCSFAEAASMPLAALTSLISLRDLLQIQSGESLLINGASGGVGVFAVQMARIMGAKTTAVCSYRNVEMVRELGADEVVDYTKVKPIELADRFDAVYDVYGNYPFSRARNLLKPQGRHVSTIPSPGNFWQVFWSRWQRQRSHVVVVRSRTQDLDQLTAWMTKGELRPVVDQVYPMTEAQEAHAYLEQRRAKGKVVLKISD